MGIFGLILLLLASLL